MSPGDGISWLSEHCAASEGESEPVAPMVLSTVGERYLETQRSA